MTASSRPRDVVLAYIGHLELSGELDLEAATESSC